MRELPEGVTEKLDGARRSLGGVQLTKSAHALCLIAMVRGGFTSSELGLALCYAHRSGDPATVADVRNALQDLYDKRREEIAEPGDPDAERVEAIAYYREFVKERGDTLGA